MEQFFPEVHAEFVAPLPVVERHDLLQAYRQRLFDADPAIYIPATRAWSRYEGRCLYLTPDPEAIGDFSTDAVSIGVGRPD